MAFAGSDIYGVFSGGYNATTGKIQWGTAPESGSNPSCWATGGANCRPMAFAACGGKLYVTNYDAIFVRTDGTNPSWAMYYVYSGPPLANPAQNSGFRGLTCVPNLYGSGSMLIAGLEGPGDIYDIPLNGSQPTVELHMSNYLSTQLSAWVGYVISAYNNMTVYPQSGSTSCPDLLIGLLINAQQYPNAYQGNYPSASYLVRHCNGAYDKLYNIVAPSITPAPPLLATRTLAVSQFPGDPAGTLYAGGYDSHNTSTHNSAWIYQGIPTNPQGQVAQGH
jgi:hypothetical protein